MGHGTLMGREEMHTGFWWGNLATWKTQA